MITAAAFAGAATGVVLPSNPYAPVAAGATPSAARQRRRRLRRVVTSVASFR